MSLPVFAEAFRLFLSLLMVEMYQSSSFPLRWIENYILRSALSHLDFILKLPHLVAELRTHVEKKKGNPRVDFLMVIVASGIARGRVRTTTTAELPDMAAILQKIG